MDLKISTYSIYALFGYRAILNNRIRKYKTQI
jgi:hypothetical protein